MVAWEDAEFASPHKQGACQRLVGETPKEMGRTPKQTGRMGGN